MLLQQPGVLIRPFQQVLALQLQLPQGLGVAVVGLVQPFDQAHAILKQGVQFGPQGLPVRRQSGLREQLGGSLRRLGAFL